MALPSVIIEVKNRRSMTAVILLYMIRISYKIFVILFSGDQYTVSFDKYNLVYHHLYFLFFLFWEEKGCHFFFT